MNNDKVINNLRARWRCYVKQYIGLNLIYSDTEKNSIKYIYFHGVPSNANKRHVTWHIGNGGKHLQQWKPRTDIRHDNLLL